MDNSLAVRTEEAGVAIIDLLVKLEVDIDLCNKKWENTCKQKKCGESDIKDYDLELSLIIKACVEKLKVIIGAGLVLSELHISVIVDLCVKIFLSINLYLNILFKLCGFRKSLSSPLRT